MTMGGAGIAFLFVVDGPRLQAQSLLLAASLRHYHHEARLIACLPRPAEALPAVVEAAFARCAVESRVLPEAGGLWRQPYPHGNKILALSLPNDGTWSVFLDTDMAAVAPLSPATLPGPMEVSVVPEGVIIWGKPDHRWPRAYAHFGLPMPEERIRLLRGGRRLSPPYFNAGFVAIRDADRVEGKGFGTLWRETAVDFDHHAAVGGKRPWLDQITLPLTMRRFGFTPRLVGEENNLSISNDRRLPDIDPVILHYHRMRFLRAWPGWPDLRALLLDTLPAAHHLAALAMLDDRADTAPAPHGTDG